MEIIRIGVDLAKSVFQVHGVDVDEQPVWQKQLSRKRWLSEVVRVAPRGCEIGMEACASAHHWARQLEQLGFVVKLIAPQFVKPYVKSNKTDAHDAAAICEAMSRPQMRFVAVKTIEQQDIQAAHRIRASLVQQRTAKVNQIRGLTAEYGLVAPVGIRRLRAAMRAWVEPDLAGLSIRFKRLLRDLIEDLEHMDERIATLDEELESIARTHPDARRLQQLRGIGPLTATALVAHVGDARHFANGRQMAAALGLTPRQHSSGGKPRLLGISKRGNTYLRTLLIHGARAVVRHAVRHDDALSRWVTDLARRRHANIAATALANKTARIAWAMLRSGNDYDPSFRAAA